MKVYQISGNISWLEDNDAPTDYERMWELPENLQDVLRNDGTAELRYDKLVVVSKALD